MRTQLVVIGRLRMANKRAEQTRGCCLWQKLILAGVLAFGGLSTLMVVWQGARQAVDRRGMKGERLVQSAEAIKVDGATLARDEGPAKDAVGYSGGELWALERSFGRLARKLSKSAVAVTAVRGDFKRDSDDPALQTRVVGSGFALDGAGSIVTSLHVVEGATEVWVTTDAGEVIGARVAGIDERFDLAVLKLSEKADLQPVVFAGERAETRGRWVLTMGNPFGLAGDGELAYSVGVISAIDRELPRLAQRENRLYTSLLQVTLPLNPGNSGGGVFDLDGRLVGVAAAVVMPQRNTNGIGFAIPASEAMKRRLLKLAATGRCEYGSLGVSLAGVESSVDGRGKAELVRVMGTAGRLRDGDELVSVGGVRVRGRLHAIQLVSERQPGEKVELVVLRGADVLRWNEQVQPERIDEAVSTMQ